MTEFWNPENLSSPATSHSLMRNALHEIQRRDSAQVKWIDKIKARVLTHDFTHGQRRNAFGHAQFNDAHSTGGPSLERAMLRGRMLRESGPQPQPTVERVLENRRKAAGIGRNLIAFTRQRKQGVLQWAAPSLAASDNTISSLRVTHDQVYRRMVRCASCPRLSRSSSESHRRMI